MSRYTQRSIKYGVCTMQGSRYFQIVHNSLVQIFQFVWQDAQRFEVTWECGKHSTKLSLMLIPKIPIFLAFTIVTRPYKLPLRLFFFWCKLHVMCIRAFASFWNDRVPRESLCRIGQWAKDPPRTTLWHRSDLVVTFNICMNGLMLFGNTTKWCFDRT